MLEQIPAWLLVALGIGAGICFLTALPARRWFALLGILMALVLGLGVLGVGSGAGAQATGGASFELRLVAVIGLAILVLPVIVRLLPLFGGLFMLGVMMLLLPEAMRYAVGGALGLSLLLSGYRAVIKAA